MSKTAAATTVALPKDATEIAMKSVDQAQAAFDKASDVAHENVQVFDAAASAFRTNAADFQMKAMEYAQTNVNAVFELLRSVITARQPQDVIELQKTFVAGQFQALASQASELGTLGLKLASETAIPVQAGVMKSLDEVRKAFAA